MSEQEALKRLSWAPQTADPKDAAMNALERKGLAIRSRAPRADGKAEWRITAAGAEKLYPELRSHGPKVAA